MHSNWDGKTSLSIDKMVSYSYHFYLPNSHTTQGSFGHVHVCNVNTHLHIYQPITCYDVEKLLKKKKKKGEVLPSN